MRRVVVTGLGIVSSIGTTAEEVAASLKAGRSGITANAEMAEHGFRSQVAGAIDLDPADHIDKRTLRFMGPGAAYSYIAMGQAIADAGLEEADVVDPMTGLIAGSGGPSTSAMLQAHQTVLNSGSTGGSVPSPCRNACPPRSARTSPRPTGSRG
jgi:3-oxoacyl-[acyl-carrier-protein] synthase-1